MASEAKPKLQMRTSFRSITSVKNTALAQKIFWLVITGLYVFLSVLMVRISLQYISLRDDVAFLLIKQSYIGITHWKIAFFIHALSSFLILPAGLTQFSRTLLRRHKPLHRWMGRWYIWIILFVAGPSGFVMAFYANGGWTSRVAFVLLGSLWLWTTYNAYQTARTRQFKAHRNWMYRSFALTLSALTLRAWKWLIVMAFAPPPMDVYRVVAWLGFVPNLLLAEYLIRRHRASKPAAPDENL